MPVKAASQDGGLFPHWRDPNTVEFGIANKYPIVFHPDSGKTDAVEIKLSVPRAIGRGTIALTNARIITLSNRRVIEKARSS